MSLSNDELDRSYRAALRRIAQERARGDAFRDALLHEKGRHMMRAQQIDMVVETVEREHRTQQTGHDIEAIAANAGVQLDTPT